MYGNAVLDDGAGQLHRLKQRRRLEHQHVGPGAQRQVGRAAAVKAGGLALIEAARAHHVHRELGAAGVARVGEAGGQRQHVSSRSDAAAHHEDAQRRLRVEAVAHAAQPPVVPAQLQLVEARRRGVGAELHVARKFWKVARVCGRGLYRMRDRDGPKSPCYIGG